MSPSPSATPTIAPPAHWGAESVTQPAPALSLEVRQSVEKSANWFFWVAALSLVNSAIVLSGNQWSFIIGLGFTQVIDAVLMNFGPAGMGVAIVLDLCVVSIFAGIGIFARKCHMWAFIVGFVLYAADTLIFLLVGDVLSIGFHAFVIFNLWVGFKLLHSNKQN